MHRQNALLLLLATLVPALAAAGDRHRAATAAKGPAEDDRGPRASASEIPALARLLEKAQWTPTPELSGIFQAHHLFEVTELGHRPLADTCITADPREHTYTSAELVTSLQTGVSVDIALGRAAASGSLVKTIRFGTPAQVSVPGLELIITDACAEKLRRLPQARLARAYVVQEVLRAEIAAQTCGRVDARGRIVGLGAAEAELAQACAQVSLEPVAVAVGYRTVPLASLLGPEAAPPSPTPSDPRPPATPPGAAEWVGSSGYAMVGISPGSFSMGSPPSERGRGPDESQHQVALSTGFYIGTTEVSQGLWRSVMGSNPSTPEYKGVPLQGDSLPVQNVDWCDAVAFAKELSARDGFEAAYSRVADCKTSKSASVRWDRSRDGYRLPTEAEWEYAARAGERQLFAGTERYDEVCTVANVSDLGARARFGWKGDWSKTCSDQHAGLAPVGSYPANAWGLADMSGSVWEWRWDWHAAYGDTAADPAGPPSGTNRVLRGGSWSNFPRHARVAGRFWGTPDYRLNDLGLRLARTQL